jgi:glutamine synthetase
MNQLQDKESVRQFVKNQMIERFKIGLVDLNGILRGKYISKDKFISGLDSGLSFCDVIIGCDVNDDLIKDLNYTGWHTGYPDAPISIIPQTGRVIPDEPNTMFFLCEFKGKAEALCSRSILRKIIQKSCSLGYIPYAAFEYEFSIFNETVDSVREKSYRNLAPLSGGNFGYSFLRSTQFNDMYHEIIDTCNSVGISIEGLHTEIGPGILEAAIHYSEALQAADNAIMFKNMLKIIAYRRNLVASFMAKYSVKQQGQSGHIHISLRNKNNHNVFYAQNAEHGMSQVMRHFVAGQIHYMPQLLALVAQTVNDYARLVPGFWAPIEANWSIDNRTSALRVITGSEQSQRVEYRIASASSNPYLALSAALLSGLIGIEQSLPLGEPIGASSGNSQTKITLPSSLSQAASALKKSELAKSIFGKIFVEDYAKSREHEQHLYNQQVTDWQLKRYFEII